jgi:predicted double-glycine peptidase
VTPIVTMVAQRHKADCGAATLAMVLGISYEDALIALGGQVPQVLRRGVWFPELQRAAESLGVTLTLRKRWTADEHEGIAQVKFKDGTAHVVVIREGLVFDTDLSVWDPADYLKAQRGTFGSLLVREDA